MKKHRRLQDEYQFPGYRPKAALKGIFGDPYSVVIKLERRQKKNICGCCGTVHRTFYDRKVRRIRDLPCGDKRVYLEVEVRRVFCKKCGLVKMERVPWIAENGRYTKLLTFFIGRKCRTMTVKDVAKEQRLDWHSVKEMDKQYMVEQLRRIGTPGPRIIGVDEVSLRKGHVYRIIVSDLERKRPIWFGGTNRSEESMDEFYAWLGPKKAAKIRLAVMDMWSVFEASVRKNAPQAAILYDKFHVIRHLQESLDVVRKQEYARLTGSSKKFIKGQKYTLLSRRENLTNDGRKNLAKLLKINKRLNVAYMLKESFGQLWDYDAEGWARKFFENWKKSLKWQRLKPYEKFCGLIERHWDGLAAYCRPENKVSLGYVEGLNTKIRVIQRRAYGFRDEEYLRLKILTCMLEAI